MAEKTPTEETLTIVIYEVDADRGDDGGLKIHLNHGSERLLENYVGGLSPGDRDWNLKVLKKARDLAKSIASILEKAGAKIEVTEKLLSSFEER